MWVSIRKSYRLIMLRFVLFRFVSISFHFSPFPISLRVVSSRFLSCLGCIQKCKGIANVLPWIPVPNDERQQEQAGVQGKTLASNLHFWTQTLIGSLCIPCPHASRNEKIYFLICVPNEDSNQPAQPHSLTRVFVVRMKKLCIIGYLKCTQWRFRLDCANAQTDLYLRWHTCPKIRFLICGSIRRMTLYS